MRQFLMIIMILTASSVLAQKTITKQNLIWYAYIQNLKINDRFSIQTDIQERYFIAPAKQGQFLIRSAFKTIIASNWDFGAGIAFFLTNTDPSVDYTLETPEVRPHIEFNNKQTLKHVSISHRYRLEARVFHNISGSELVKGFGFGNMRFRYQFGVDFPLNKPKENKNTVKLRLAEEMMLNFGSKIKYNLFDQNRVYATLQYAPVPSVAIEVGYLNWFQQRSSGNKYFSRNILRIAIINNIIVKQKKKKEETTPAQ